MYCLQIQAIHHIQTLQLIVVQCRITRTSQSLKQRSHLEFAYQIDIISKHFCRKWISVDFKKCVTLEGILDQQSARYCFCSKIRWEYVSFDTHRSNYTYTCHTDCFPKYWFDRTLHSMTSVFRFLKSNSCIMDGKCGNCRIYETHMK